MGCFVRGARSAGATLVVVVLDVTSAEAFTIARELPAATPVTIRLSELDTPSMSPTSAIREAGLSGRAEAPFVLEVRAILHASPDRRATPTLRSLSMEVWCVEGE